MTTSRTISGVHLLPIDAADSRRIN